MSSTPPAAPQLEGSMFLFKKPALLNKETHGSMGISRPERPFAYAENVRAIPLTLSEIASAGRHYPIIFSDEANPLPLAVVGIIDEENLFVDEKGDWEVNTYIPGYLRRYPFALANDRDSVGDNQRMAMIVDEGYEGMKEGGELPFFTDGEPSAEMKQTMEYCQNYERDRVLTMQLAKELPKYKLLSEQIAQFTPEGSATPMPFAKYFAVEEKRLQELSDNEFLGLRKSNILPLIYAQMLSMGNWRVLMERRARRHNLQGDAVLKQRTVS
ncbi:SapC family protein [Parvularcula sp. LCG005]|uniref:SapC family protein n=1 Tax=Parvularcula sp. LCG005 TaxID=3078805 RepID=UPI0029435FA2|nr:SapC family protein [Parvularcula sp. LCG005]WOI52098.1 SapC family protein [Parvularcula sp. LCG005]